MANQDTKQEEHAVRGVIANVYAAWAKNDADAFVVDYLPDATAVLPGSYLANRDIIHGLMRSLFAGPLKGSSALHEIQAVRFYGETSVVISKSVTVPAGQGQPGDGWGVDTWVLAKQGGAWRIAAFHSAPAKT